MPHLLLSIISCSLLNKSEWEIKWSTWNRRGICTGPIKCAMGDVCMSKLFVWFSVAFVVLALLYNCHFERWLFESVFGLIGGRGTVMWYIATFNNISVISWRSVLLVEVIRVPGESHRPVASRWKTLSHNVVSSTPHLSGDRHWLHR
jgi:hypothetical protein